MLAASSCKSGGKHGTLCLYLQVADLKKELKARGLNTVGNKIELVERLQISLQGGKLF
jgi:hypothetical protein